MFKNIVEWSVVLYDIHLRKAINERMDAWMEGGEDDCSTDCIRPLALLTRTLAAVLNLLAGSLFTITLAKSLKGDPIPPTAFVLVTISFFWVSIGLGFCSFFMCLRIPRTIQHAVYQAASSHRVPRTTTAIRMERTHQQEGKWQDP